MSEAVEEPPREEAGASKPHELRLRAAWSEGVPAGPAGARSGQSMWRSVLVTARPKQWIKNVLVFAAPGAAGVLTHADSFGRAAAAFALFACVSSGTYFLNDSLDASADRLHPLKRLRPVAAGLLPVPIALLVASALIAVGIATSSLLAWQLTVVLASYVGIQVAYNLWLKRQPVYDLACVTAGFVLRAIAGGIAVGVPVSEWFLIVASFGSLLMVTGKRLAELLELGDGAAAHRSALQHYSPTFLRTILAVATAGALLGYCMWAFRLASSPLYHDDPIWYQLSVVPMGLGLLRYLFLVERGHGARPEDLVLSDLSLVALGVAWAVLFALGLYVS